MEWLRKFRPSVATVAIWTIAYAAWTADWIVEPMPHLLERSVRRLLTCAFGVVLCEGAARVLAGTRTQSRARRAAVALGLCVLMSAVYSAVNTLAFYVIDPLWGATTLAEVLQLALTVGWVFLAWTALYFAMEADAQARDARVRLAEVTAAELRARNQALAAQIHPHFLFNALNTVSGLILDGMAERAERVTVSLASLLRRSLESDDRTFISLAEELQAIRRYIEIEEARFEDRFSYVETVPEDCLGFPVPPLILQPLVENTMRHGVAHSTRQVKVAVVAERDEADLILRVLDDAELDCTASRSPGQGIGQSNVRERLAVIYGPRATLTCGSVEEGYIAQLRVPPEAAHHA